MTSNSSEPFQFKFDELLISGAQFVRRKAEYCWVSFFLIALMFFVSSAVAQSKDGVGLSKISLPNGPGSIEGLGEAFEPQLNSGTSSHSVNIAIPPGVNGLQPEITLRYNSGRGNGHYGLAWSYEPMAISRQTVKGLPTYSPNDIFVYQGEELVPLSDGTYRLENESAFMRFRPKNNSWEVHDKKGTHYRYGIFLNEDEPNRRSRITRPEGDDFDNTYKWCLTEVIDTRGNRIEYRYETFADSPGDLYCTEIRYSIFGNNYHYVRFLHRPRTDAFSSYISGFEIRTGRRCKEIQVRSLHDGSDQLVRRYELNYATEESDPVEPISLNDVELTFSLLRKVTQFDNGRFDAFLPPLRFGYTRFDANRGRFGVLFNTPEFSLGNPNLAFADINTDSLPDLFYTDPIKGTHVVYYNLGNDRFSDPIPFSSFPTGVTLENSETQLADFDGDARIDLIQKAGGELGVFNYFPNTTPPSGNDENNPFWGQEQSFDQPFPFFDLDDPSVRSLDLNGDKRIDFFRTTSAGFLYYYNTGTTWEEDGLYLWGEEQLGDITFADDIQFSKPGPGGRPVANERVKLADMNGDRLLDLARLNLFGTKLEVQFWPNMGRGYWGDREEMTGDIDLGVAAIEDAFITDINLDGLADVVAVHFESISYWINLGNNHFSGEFLVEDTPRYVRGETLLKQADINGNGSTDFLWENFDAQSGRFLIEYFDFVGETKPNLMAVIDNGIGLRTEIEYRTTTDYYVHARNGGNPWETRLPFPSHVVSKVTQRFGLDLAAIPGNDEYISEFQYHNGYYDPFEKEFRGFAFAKKVERGDDRFVGSAVAIEVQSPSTITRFAFHTGVADNLDNDNDGRFDEFDEIGGFEEEALKGKPLWQEVTLLTPDFDGRDNDGDGWVDEDDEGEANGLPANNDVVFTRTLNDWGIKTVHNEEGGFVYRDARLRDQPHLSLPYRTMDRRPVSFPFPAGTTTELVEANGRLASLDNVGAPFPPIPQRPPKIIHTETEFDFYGNPIVQKEFGENSTNSLLDDERFTFSILAFNIDNWIIGLPAITTVEDENGQFISETRNYYDGNAFEGLGSGQVGNFGEMTWEEVVITGPNGSELPALTEFSRFPGDPRAPSGSVIQLARNRYDPFGNVKAVADANYDPNEPNKGHWREFEYDPTFHTYVTAEIVHVGDGHADLSAAQITKSIDFNDRATTYHYDSFWRITSVVQPFDRFEFPTTTYTYRPADPNRFLYYNYDTFGQLDLEVTANATLVSAVTIKNREQAGTGNTYDIIHYTDGAGHKLGAVEEGESANEWIYKDVKRYTSRGQERDAFLPFFTNSLEYQVPPSETAHISNFYDAFARPIKTVNPPETDDDGARQTQSHSVFLPLETISYDEEDSFPQSPHFNTPMTHFKDGLDRLIKVHELNREAPSSESSETAVVQTYLTEYQWDLLDDLIHIKDAQDNEKYMRYDALGRKIFMNDPDRGHMTYDYDNESNLLETVDAKGQEIRYTYDGANRMRTEDYLDAGNQEVGANVEGAPPPPRPFSFLRIYDPTQPISKTNQPDVEYRYDNASTDYPDFTNLKGRLAHIIDLSGEEFLNYDDRGNINQKIKRIPPAISVTSASFGAPGKAWLI